MKKSITLLFLFFDLLFVLLVTPVYATELRQFNCRVVGISDGDTISCLTTNKKLYKIRLLHIDAPESAQAFGNQARRALSNMIFKKEVKIRSSGYDSYQRLLGVVLDDKDKNINLQLVEQGMA